MYYDSIDSFLISFPKCGVTWLRLMLSRVFVLQHQVEARDPFDVEGLSSLSRHIPRIRVTHEDSCHEKRPEELSQSKDQWKRKSVIFLIRDPRDVVVSSFFHKRHQARYKPRPEEELSNLSAYIRCPVGSLETLITYYNVWYKNRAIPKRFLLVRYEDLQRNAAAELQRVLKFVGINTVSPNVISESVKFASFENMRNMEIAGRNERYLQRRDPSNHESFKTRRGKVGGYLDYLSGSDREYVESRICARLDPAFGYNHRSGRIAASASIIPEDTRKQPMEHCG